MAKFYGIGVGPGDEGLLTVKAAEALKNTDVLFLPETKKDEEGVAFRIVKQYLKEELKKEFVNFPMVVDEPLYDRIGLETAEKIIGYVNEGLTVSFITLGDATVYSTYGYIVKNLRGKVPVETIPGITSFCAAAALANRQLIEKDEVLCVIPMNASEEKINRVLDAGDSFAMMKVYRRGEKAASLLEKHNLRDDAILALDCGFATAHFKEDAPAALRENENYLSVVLARKDRNGIR